MKAPFSVLHMYTLASEWNIHLSDCWYQSLFVLCFSPGFFLPVFILFFRPVITSAASLPHRCPPALSDIAAAFPTSPPAAPAPLLPLRPLLPRSCSCCCLAPAAPPDVAAPRQTSQLLAGRRRSTPDDHSLTDPPPRGFFPDVTWNRSTRGQPTKKYEPTLQTKAKYPVANFISTKRLSKSYESFVNQLNWPLRQFDVKNAFLHGELTEEVYMDLPPGYKIGYMQSNSDHTLFLKHQQEKVTALIIYVDDMVVTGNDTIEVDRLQKQLATEFEMKDLGTLKYFLGIEVARGSDDQVPTDKTRYQRLVGRLIYLSHTRPDVAYAVSIVSQFMHNPSVDHMDAVVRILRYLKSAPGRGVMFSNHNNSLEICGFKDAYWAGNITGYAFAHDGVLVEKIHSLLDAIGITGISYIPRSVNGVAHAITTRVACLEGCMWLRVGPDWLLNGNDISVTSYSSREASGISIASIDISNLVL
ncbi:uncharacterized protein LOC126787056 [Argentina anserina]|uniref:uncharacterized protein LOC126787056 n=1 Tax=Argentina anserina TaxID=57926 RepID=UPI0021769060|nr:uncharacterized protein LOC126787056 [Potentilla anserina]